MGGPSWYPWGFLQGRRVRGGGPLGLVRVETRRPAAWLLVSSVPAPGEAGGFQAGSPSLCLSLPQGFVLAVTIIREAVEEIRCYMRDKEVNSQVYSRLTARGEPPAAQPQGGGGRGGHRVPTWPRAADAQGAEFTARAGGVWAAGAGQSLSGRRQGGQRVPRAWGAPATSLGRHCARGPC